MRKFVARQLLPYEFGVGLVLVEGIHHIIAIAPDVGPVTVFVPTVGLGVAHQVEPEAGPALAMARIVEQSVHQTFPGVGRLVFHEAIHLIGCGGHAHEVEIEPADENGLFRLGRGLDTGLALALEDEMIDGVTRPGIAFERGHFGLRERLKSPPCAIRLGDFTGGRANFNGMLWPGRTRRDPRFEQGDIALGE